MKKEEIKAGVKVRHQELSFEGVLTGATSFSGHVYVLRKDDGVIRNYDIKYLDIIETNEEKKKDPWWKGTVLEKKKRKVLKRLSIDGYQV